MSHGTQPQSPGRPLASPPSRTGEIELSGHESTSSPPSNRRENDSVVNNSDTIEADRR